MNKQIKTSIFLLLTLLTVFLFFYPTLFFKVKMYDEIIPFKETFLPSCFSLSEMLELISLLGLKQHFEATNSLYSNIVSLRCNPFGNFLQMLIQLLFRKNPFNYHLYSLSLHILNTTILFLLLNKISLQFNSSNKKNLRLILVSILTLIWALHPVNIESVLLLTNANIILSYTFSFLTFLICLNTENIKNIFLKYLLPFVTFSIALFTAEFHFLLPLIIIAYKIALDLHDKKFSLKKCFIIAIKSVIPLLISDLIFLILFLFSNTGVNLTNQLSIKLFLERIFWLSPQIIFHFTKLLLLPIKLSIDQTFLVKLGKSLFDPYALFCIVFICLLLIFALYSLLNSKKKFGFLIISLYLISILPFSQFIAPLYNLASERYLYEPTFILIIGLSHCLFYLFNKTEDKVKFGFVILFAVILTAFGTRAYFRTLDWKDSFTLYSSAANATDNPLFKAFRIKGLIPQEFIFSRYPESAVDIKYKKEALANLKNAVELFENQAKKYQSSTPEIIKHYGLDPETLHTKAGYTLSQVDFSINNDIKRAYELIKPFTKNLSLPDSAGLSYYASILYFNNYIDQAENVLLTAYDKNPYSTRIIFPLCDLIQSKYGDLQKMEELTLKAFKYFPYDTYTLLILTKVYELKKEPSNYAKFEYIYGLRHHSINDLENARKVFLMLNNNKMVQRADKRISELNKILQNK